MRIDLNGTLLGFAVVLVVGMLTGGTLYGCKRAGDQYYEFAEKCIKAGGSWVPRSEESYSGICVAPRQG